MNDKLHTRIKALRQMAYSACYPLSPEGRRILLAQIEKLEQANDQ